MATPVGRVTCGITISADGYAAGPLTHHPREPIAPLMLGAGTRLFEGVPPLRPEQVTSRPASRVTHVTYRVLP
ncbi:hypothetical protein [Streptomyces hawaiiensis]|uniref:hypothetical protein n=1 Tax=Streptomyces hawaiiensis TaxID=67305 RepID=UPI003655A68B